MLSLALELVAEVAAQAEEHAVVELGREEVEVGAGPVVAARLGRRAGGGGGAGRTGGVAACGGGSETVARWTLGVLVGGAAKVIDPSRAAVPPAARAAEMTSRA